MPAQSTKHPQPDWTHHIEALHDSGLSRAEYCRQTGLDYDQFRYYTRKLSPHPTGQADASVDSEHHHPLSDFVPMAMLSRPERLKSEFTLTLTDGSILSWSADWTPQQVLEFAKGWNAKC